MIDRELRRLRDRAAKFIDEVSDAGIKWPGTLARFALKEIDRDRQQDDETGEPFIDPDAGVIDEQWVDDYHPFVGRSDSFVHWVMICGADGHVFTVSADD